MNEKLKQRGLCTEIKVLGRASDPYDVGMEVDSRAIEALETNGYNPWNNLSKRYSQLITAEELRSADRVYCMDEENIESIVERYGESFFSKLTLLGDDEILDPWYNGRFAETLGDIELAIDALLDEI